MEKMYIGTYTMNNDTTLTWFFLKGNFNYLRIKPLNQFGAPARGATVTIKSNKRIHSKTIDAGSGYLCQMEPIAHYGLRKNENNISVKVTWTNGSEDLIKVIELNKVITIQQKRLIK